MGWARAIGVAKLQGARRRAARGTGLPGRGGEPHGRGRGRQLGRDRIPRAYHDRSTRRVPSWSAHGQAPEQGAKPADLDSERMYRDCSTAAAADRHRRRYSTPTRTLGKHIVLTDRAAGADRLGAVGAWTRAARPSCSGFPTGHRPATRWRDRRPARGHRQFPDDMDEQGDRAVGRTLMSPAHGRGAARRTPLCSPTCSAW